MSTSSCVLSDVIPEKKFDLNDMQKQVSSESRSDCRFDLRHDTPSLQLHELIEEKLGLQRFNSFGVAIRLKAIM